MASNGIRIILTARDEKRGNKAVEELIACGLSDVLFHQLDVKDPSSIASLAKFIETNFNKLDILVRNYTNFKRFNCFLSQHVYFSLCLVQVIILS